MTDATTVVSPLRRRMIDDMTLRNLSPATQRSYLHAVRKLVNISTALRINWGLRTSAPFKSIWCRRVFPGQRSTRRSARFAFSTV
jgi:hypothetical protein